MKPGNGRIFACNFRAWIPIALGASLAQTLRNAAQRHLTRDLAGSRRRRCSFFTGCHLP
jgi:hypothetical protein